MKLRLYLAMPFFLLLLTIMKTHWANPMILALGCCAGAVAYVTLVLITEKEIKKASDNSKKSFGQTTTDDYLSKTQAKHEAAYIAEPEVFSIGTPPE